MLFCLASVSMCSPCLSLTLTLTLTLTIHSVVVCNDDDGAKSMGDSCRCRLAPRIFDLPHPGTSSCLALAVDLFSISSMHNSAYGPPCYPHNLPLCTPLTPRHPAHKVGDTMTPEQSHIDD